MPSALTFRDANIDPWFKYLLPDPSIGKLPSVLWH